MDNDENRGPRLTVPLTAEQDRVLTARAEEMHRSRAAHVRALIEEDHERTARLKSVADAPAAA